MKKAQEVSTMTNKQKKELVKADYDAIADSFSAEEKNVKFYSPFINKFLNTLDKGPILDACCGSGEFSDYIAKQNIPVVGVDFSSKLIQIARKKYKNVEFVVSDICKFKFGKPFCGIFTKNSLFHLPDKDINKVLRNFYTMLADNGKLFVILTIPKESGENVYVEPMDNRFSLYYNYLTVDKVKQLLIDNSFKIDELKIVNESKFIYAKGIMFIYASKQ